MKGLDQPHLDAPDLRPDTGVKRVAISIE